MGDFTRALSRAGHSTKWQERWCTMDDSFCVLSNHVNGRIVAIGAGKKNNEPKNILFFTDRENYNSTVNIELRTVPYLL